MTRRLRSRLSEPTVLFLATALLSSACVLPTVGYAAQVVFDATSAAKLSEQLNSMREQTDKLGEITQQGVDLKNKVQDQINAIGKASKITLPMTNAASLMRSLEREAMCLLPNVDGLFPKVRFEELDLSSICSARRSYSDAAWFDPEKLLKKLGRTPTWLEERPYRESAKTFREKLTKDSISGALASSHIVGKKVGPETRRTIDELESAEAGATNLQERTTVTNRLLVPLNRQVEQQIRLQAENNKLLAVLAMQGEPLDGLRHTITKTGEGRDE